MQERMNHMANTYDNYYDIQPYRSFSDLERTEDIPDYGDPEEDFSDELLEAAILEGAESLPPFYEDYPMTR